MRTICLDFDGVLHAYTSPWTESSEISDGPVPGARAFCEILLGEGFSVVVFSSRAADESGRRAIEAWLAEHNFPLAVRVAHGGKPQAEIYVDDRGYRFEGDFTACLNFIRKGVRPWNKKGK